MICYFYVFTLGQSLYQVSSSQCLFLWLLVPSLVPAVLAVIFLFLLPGPSLARAFHFYYWWLQAPGVQLTSEAKGRSLIEVLFPRVLHRVCVKLLRKDTPSLTYWHVPSSTCRQQGCSCSNWPLLLIKWALNEL